MNRQKMIAEIITIIGEEEAKGKNLDKMTDEALAELMMKLKSAQSVQESVKLTEEAFVESTGGIWEVTIIKAGLSKNNFFYSPEVLQKAVPIFEGVQVFAHQKGGHISQDQKSTRDLIGFIEKVRFENNSLKGNLNILPSGNWFKEDLVFLNSKNRLDVFQLSIHADGLVIREQDRTLVTNINLIFSVDVVPKGAAGGGFDKLLESYNYKNISTTEGVTTMKNKLMLLFTMLYPTFLESKNVDWLKLNENELFTHLLEADKPRGRLHLPDGTKLSEQLVDDKLKLLLSQNIVTASTDLITGDKALKEAIEKVEKISCSLMLTEALNTSNLPIPIVEDLKSRFSNKIFKVEEINQAIKASKDTLAKLQENMPISTSVKLGEEAHDKAKKGFLGLLIDTPQHRLTADERKLYLGDIPPMRSLKEAYIHLTGDEKITGYKKNSVKLSEAIDTKGFDQVAQDVLHIAMVREYNLAGLDTWRPFTDIIPRGDFKPNHIYRYGGYGAPPVVAESASYQQLTSPTDEEATYALTKKGGIESITLEMIRNDDVGAIRQIPRKLGRGCAYGLYYTIYFTMLRPAGAHTIYDSATLYHASHPIKAGTTFSNTGIAAIATGLDLALTSMMNAPEKDSNIPIGIRGKYVLVPPALRTAAYGLVTSAYGVYNTVPTAVQAENLQVITVPCWTDVTDYAVVANPSDCLGLEVGFLDGNDTPELFVSDNPNAGSWFTNDMITYKCRFVWGAAVKDWRAFYGQTVA